MTATRGAAGASSSSSSSSSSSDDSDASRAPALRAATAGGGGLCGEIARGGGGAGFDASGGATDRGAGATAAAAGGFAAATAATTGAATAAGAGAGGGALERVAFGGAAFALFFRPAPPPCLPCAADAADDARDPPLIRERPDACMPYTMAPTTKTVPTRPAIYEKESADCEGGRRGPWWQSRSEKSLGEERVAPSRRSASQRGCKALNALCTNDACHTVHIRIYSGDAFIRQ